MPELILLLLTLKLANAVRADILRADKLQLLRTMSAKSTPVDPDRITELRLGQLLALKLFKLLRLERSRDLNLFPYKLAEYKLEQPCKLMALMLQPLIERD